MPPRGQHPSMVPMAQCGPCMPRAARGYPHEGLLRPPPWPSRRRARPPRGAWRVALRGRGHCARPTPHFQDLTDIGGRLHPRAQVRRRGTPQARSARPCRQSAGATRRKHQCRPRGTQVVRGLHDLRAHAAPSQRGKWAQHAHQGSTAPRPPSAVVVGKANLVKCKATPHDIYGRGATTVNHQVTPSLTYATTTSATANMPN